jgi:hypothetical protein
MISRRTILASVPLLAQQLADAKTEDPKPFRVAVPDAAVKRILRRVRETRLPERLAGNDWRYGADWDYLRELREYWTNKFDWHAAQANLNRYPQFQARVEDFDIHF